MDTPVLSYNLLGSPKYLVPVWLGPGARLFALLLCITLTYIVHCSRVSGELEEDSPVFQTYPRCCADPGCVLRLQLLR